MQDGSDAVSDWPLLNALLNTACGATWVSLHHGGGVGMGFSQHSGMVIVCDGTRSGAPSASRACCGTTRPPASCATPMPATRSPSTAREKHGSTCPASCGDATPPRRDRIAVPWKNGGGVTREIAVWPPGAGIDDFDWRISMAEVRGDGPFFLDLPRYVDRVLGCAGGGLRLDVEGEAPVTLERGTRPAAFPGDAPTTARVESAAWSSTSTS